MTGPAQTQRQATMFASLRHRNYRLYWLGTLVSSAGDWLDHVALNWLIMTQTGSAYDLGLMNVMRGIPMLIFTLVGGALADRWKRHHLMIGAQFAAMVLAVVLAALVLLEATPMWALLTLATARGVVVSFSLPARHSLIPALVPHEDLPNAVALNSATMNLTKVIGPVTAGLIISFWGISACFVINAVSFIAVLVSLAFMRFPDMPIAAGRKEGVGAAIVSGWRYILSDRTILALVLLSIVPTMFGQPYLHLLAVYAYEVTSWGAMGLGLMTASSAAGAVVGALCIAGSKGYARRGSVMLGLLAGFGLALMLVAVNPVDLAAPLLLAFAGAAFIGYTSVHATMIQMLVPDAYRGRVLSTLFLNRATVSLGTGALAMLASATSIRVSYAAMATVILLCAGIAARSARLRQLVV